MTDQHARQHGIHLTCQVSDATLAFLVADLRVQLVAMGDDACVIASGRSRKRGWGFVEIVWNGDEVDQEFLEEVEQDPLVLDVCVYLFPPLRGECLRVLEAV